MQLFPLLDFSLGLLDLLQLSLPRVYNNTQDDQWEEVDGVVWCVVVCCGGMGKALKRMDFGELYSIPSYVPDTPIILK
jgi:hypothetical protein